MKFFLFLASLLYCKNPHDVHHSPSEFSQKVVSISMINGNEVRRQFDLPPVSLESPASIYYNQIHMQANPCAPHAFSSIKEKVTHNNHTIFERTYNTGALGTRITVNIKPGKNRHLIVSGDSNVFGIGSSDNETLPSRLASKLNTHTVYNLGLAGTGPNNTLYFLEHLNLRELITNNTQGVFIYDFHHHLIERVLGSKSWTQWGMFHPRYVLEDDRVIYKGQFENYWLTWFYSALNRIPFSQTLIPNLPRINRDHIKLTAKILAKMKIEYLHQTNANNRFIVLLNPVFTNNTESHDNIKQLIYFLNLENIETVTFTPNEMLPLPSIVNEGHLSATAHDNYATMIQKKIFNLK